MSLESDGSYITLSEEVVLSEASSNASEVAVAIDDSMRAIVAWVQNEKLLATVYDPGYGWIHQLGEASELSSASQSSSLPQIGWDHEFHPLIMWWSQTEGEESPRMQASRLDFETNIWTSVDSSYELLQGVVNQDYWSKKTKWLDSLDQRPIANRLLSPALASIGIDKGFSATLNGPVEAIAVQSSGKIIIGGSFTSIGGNTSYARLARLNSNGTLDTSFVANVNNTVNAIAIDSSDNIVIGGSFTSITVTTDGTPTTTAKQRIAKLNGSTGAVDTGFTASVNNNSVLSIVRQSSCTREFDEFFFATDFIDTVEWNASSDINLDRYEFYRDDVLVETYLIKDFF